MHHSLPMRLSRIGTGGKFLELLSNKISERNKIDWDFIDKILIAKGYGDKWRRWIKGFISTTNFSIIINGKPRGKIKATRGLRQGDPLSLFLFIIIMDCFSRLMAKAVEENYIKGYSVGYIDQQLHHLPFADDTILFSFHREKDVQHLFNLVDIFEKASRLNSNRQKLSYWASILMKTGQISLLKSLVAN